MPGTRSDPVVPAARDEAADFARYRETRDPAVREQLVRRFLPLARHLAGRYVGRAEREDLEQVAALALVKAIERFDPDRGLAFSSFAVPTIVGELKRYFRDLGWAVRVPRGLQELALRISRVTAELTPQLGRSPTVEELARHCEVSPEQVLEALGTVTARSPDSLDRPRTEDDDEGAGVVLGGGEDPGFARVEEAAVVEDLMSHLTERQRQILHMRFGLELTQAEIGERVGVSQMHVSRLIRQSIEALQVLAAAPSARDR